MTAQVRPDELIRILRAEFVTKSGGVPGGGCVTHVCGAVGWRATGGTAARTLVHETAFQLSAGGDARGNLAIDLQSSRWVAADVAGGNLSTILSNEENRIDANCQWSSICGPYNEILDNSDGSHILGQFNDIYDNSYSAIAIGDSHDIEDGSYVFFSGVGHTVQKPAGTNGALGVFSFLEQNDFISNANDYPTYTGSFGILNVQEGDVWYVFQFGEANKVYGLGTPGEQCLWGIQNGFENYSQHVYRNYLFGEACKSSLAAGDGYYDGRIVLSGDYPNASPADGTGMPGGYNQDSWFSQSDQIATWNVAWITSRFEFPIIQESVWGFEIHIVGTDRFSANICFWKIEGLIKNAGGATTLVWSSITNLYRDVVTKEWQVIADNPNDRLVVQFRDTAGPDATVWNIQFRMFTTEVGFN